jgi:hypothetical protein
MLQPKRCPNACGSVIAQGRSRRAVEFSRTGDPATSDFGDAKVLKKFGDVPDDLSAL